METETYTEAQLNAYNALKIAAQKISANIWRNFRESKHCQYRLISMPTTGKRDYNNRSYIIDNPNLDKVIKAMSDILDGKITPEQAMGILWEREIFDLRMSGEN